MNPTDYVLVAVGVLALIAIGVWLYKHNPKVKAEVQKVEGKIEADLSKFSQIVPASVAPAPGTEADSAAERINALIANEVAGWEASLRSKVSAAFTTPAPVQPTAPQVLTNGQQ